MEVHGCDVDDFEPQRIENGTFMGGLEPECGGFNVGHSNKDLDSGLDFNDLDLDSNLDCSDLDFNDLDWDSPNLDCSDLDINELDDSFVGSNADSALGCDDFEDNFVGPIKCESEQKNDEIIFDHDSFIRENPDDYDKNNNESRSSTIKTCNKPLCNFQSNIKRDFDNHVLTHKKKDQMPIECDYCFHRFQSISACHDHIRRKHGVSISRKYQCEICGKLVAKHNKSHICRNVIGADETDKPLPAKSSKKKSKSNAKSTNLFHSCNYCDYKSKRLYDVKRHQSIHTGKTDVFSCTEKDCSYQSSDKFSMKAHQNKHNNVGFNLDKVFECQICTINFKTKKSLAEHMKKRHPSSCTVCQDCNSLFTNVAYHRCLERKKSQTNEMCDICGESTPNLRKHKNNVHQVSPFNCDICPKKFSSKSNLEKHIQNHAKIKSKFVCDICTQIFNKSSHLKSHKLIHKEDNEEDMKSCELCSYKTLIDSNLTRHLKSHATKPLKCMFCGKCFKNNVSLRLHTKRLHS